MLEGLLGAGKYFIVTSVIVLAAVFIFDLLVKYKVWAEINKGNLAVALSTGGKILGISNIMYHAINTNENLLNTVIWGGIGTAALLIVYFAFELLTPNLNVSDEIGKGNKAVGFISFVFSVAFSFIIGASIS
ncbi:MAG: DUF350 domain-containing protein [Clostridia bacterium]|nr:DUF350 domain-containing protein [Clostridia bacterium]